VPRGNTTHYNPRVPLLFVAAGGACGAVGRYVLAGFVHRFVTPFFPWGTFVVNVAGCAVFGFLFGILEVRQVTSPNLRAFVFIGLLGGFTTFSSFAFETMELVRKGETAAALGNVGGQVVLGLIGFWLAWLAARVLLGGRV
jgi:fluoride exporter